MSTGKVALDCTQHNKRDTFTVASFPVNLLRSMYESENYLSIQILSMSGFVALKATLKRNYDYVLLKTLIHLIKMLKVSTDHAVLGLAFCTKVSFLYMHKGWLSVHAQGKLLLKTLYRHMPIVSTINCLHRKHEN